MNVARMNKNEQAEVCFRIFNSQIPKICEQAGITERELIEGLAGHARQPWYKRLWFRVKLWFA